MKKKNWVLGIAVAGLMLTGVSAASVSAENAPSMSDQELEQVSAGEFSMSLDEFDVVIQDNKAGAFSLDIAQSAFRGAQGVFTTLQTVNSAVDLNVVVNIYLNRTGTVGQ